MSYRNRWNHRLLRLLATGLATVWLTGIAQAQTSAGPGAGARRPCILFIMADGLGYGELGCYGQTGIKTPNIDQLATNGLRFTSFYAGSPEAGLSRAAIFTGRNTAHLRTVEGADYPLSGEDVTMGNLLLASGFSTGMAGAWGLGGIGTPGLPSHQGFQESYGFLSLDEARTPFPADMYRASTVQSRERFAPLEENEKGQRGRSANDSFTEFAWNFLRIFKPDQFINFRPYFLFVSYTIPPSGAADGSAYASEPWTQSEKERAAVITAMDNDIGQLLEKLKQTKADKNTIVIFTSDRGLRTDSGKATFLKSTGPLRSAPDRLYEGSLRVPLIIRWPFWMTGALTSDLPCASWDFLPTFTELARAQTPKNIDGISLVPTIIGQAQTNRHEFLYWETRKGGLQQAARMGNWKAVCSGTNNVLELYDLKTDPGEKSDVAGQHQDVVAKMRNYLSAVRKAVKE